MAATNPITFRLPEEYVQALAAASENQSGAARAYLLLGFAAAGIDMAPFASEIRRALAEAQAPHILEALWLLLGDARPESIILPEAHSSILLPAPDDDPLASIGIEF